MITKNISVREFIDEFKGREQFSEKGLIALYDYLYSLSEDIGDINLDVIDLICSYTEYWNIDEYLKEYYETEEIENLKKVYKNKEDFQNFIQSGIEDRTDLIKIDDDLNKGFIIRNY